MSLPSSPRLEPLTPLQRRGSMSLLQPLGSRRASAGSMGESKHDVGAGGGRTLQQSPSHPPSHGAPAGYSGSPLSRRTSFSADGSPHRPLGTPNSGLTPASLSSLSPARPVSSSNRLPALRKRSLSRRMSQPQLTTSPPSPLTGPQKSPTDEANDARRASTASRRSSGDVLLTPSPVDLRRQSQSSVMSRGSAGSTRMRRVSQASPLSMSDDIPAHFSPSPGASARSMTRRSSAGPRRGSRSATSVVPSELSRLVQEEKRADIGANEGRVGAPGQRRRSAMPRHLRQRAAAEEAKRPSLALTSSPESENGSVSSSEHVPALALAAQHRPTTPSLLSPRKYRMRRASAPHLVTQQQFGFTVDNESGDESKEDHGDPVARSASATVHVLAAASHSSDDDDDDAEAAEVVTFDP